MRTVGAMGHVSAGKALAAKAPGKPRPYLRTKNVFDGHIDVADVLSMPMTDAEFSRYEIRPGDVLLNEGQSLELVGRCAMYQGEYLAPCAIQNQLVRFRAHDGVSASFATHLFRYCQQTGRFTRIALQTTSIAHLGVSRFQKLPLAWPWDVTEQSTIATALSDVDALLGALEALIGKKRDVKHATMQQLLTGKTRLPGFSGRWEARRIGEFTDCTAGGTPSTLRPEYWGGRIRWMSSGELHLKIVYEVEGRITEAGLRSSSAKVLPARCVLIGLAGQGKTRGTVAVSMVPLSTNQSIAAVFPNDGFVPAYLYFNLDARYDELRAMSTGEGGRGGLNLGIIRSILVPFPSVEEQEAIATVLSDMDAEIAALKHRRDKTHAVKQGMMQQLLTGRMRLVKPAPAETGT